jgi:(p)ppGpp synthase/HD superfamily hydrolase
VKTDSFGPVSITGYSDRINHALAFAAKHHDQQVRKGTRLPYLTHPANVAIILTRYGCDETTVVAGILHDVIEDCVTKDYTRDMLEQRVASKFGSDVLETVLAVTHRKHNDDGDQFSAEEVKEDYLERLANAPERALWVCAADKLHNANSILSDLLRTIQPDSVWARFKVGKEGTIRWYRSVYSRLSQLGFDAPIMLELEKTVQTLEQSSDRASAPR